MPKTSKEKAKALSLLRWAVSHGRKWCGIYWKEEFEHQGLSVNAASVPMYQLFLIEQGTLTIEGLARCMTERSLQRGLVTHEVEELYIALWDEAISFALGCRQDSIRALAAGESALGRVERDAWMDGFWAAKQAFDIEFNLSRRTRFWGPLLYNLTTQLVRLGYGRNEPAIRPYQKETFGLSRPRSHGRRRRQ